MTNTVDTVPASPASAEKFLQELKACYDGLSPQLKLIARYVEASRDSIALEGIQDTARHCGVQPSAVVRFAKRFGFSGFSEMQALFRVGAAQRLAPDRDYQERIRTLINADSSPITSSRIAQEVINGSVQSLHALQSKLSSREFDAAVDLMMEAPAIWLVATRRSFPVGAYLAYSLQHTEKPIHWLHGLGHMQQGELRALKKGDVLIAVSFEPYAAETLEVVDAALSRGARLLAITDSQLSPLVSRADAVLLAQEASTFGFRSLTSTLCLAQSLFLGLAYRMELAGPAGREHTKES